MDQLALGMFKTHTTNIFQEIYLVLIYINNCMPHMLFMSITKLIKENLCLEPIHSMSSDCYDGQTYFLKDDFLGKIKSDLDGILKE